MREDQVPTKLNTHDIHLKIDLKEKKILLRPMTEDDWPLLNRWNSDPEVLYYSEGDDVKGYTPEQVKIIYRSVSRKAFMFIIEYNRTAIGECWLQEMNLEKINDHFPKKDCRRVDITIGEKEYWGKGIGTEVIKELTRFGFEKGADLIFLCDVAGYNKRSIRAAEKAGYERFSESKDGQKAEKTLDFVAKKGAWDK